MAAEHVEELCERIERTVSNFSIEVRGQGRARVGVSVGWAVYGSDGETLDQLVIAADEAMYRAKSSHKAIIFAGPMPEPSVTESGVDHSLEEVLNSLAIN